MTWIAEATAIGEKGAVKLTVKAQTEPTESLLAGLCARVTGQYRVQYQEWPQAPTAEKWEVGRREEAA